MEVSAVSPSNSTNNNTASNNNNNNSNSNINDNNNSIGANNNNAQLIGDNALQSHHLSIHHHHLIHERQSQLHPLNTSASLSQPPTSPSKSANNLFTSSTLIHQSYKSSSNSLMALKHHNSQLLSNATPAMEAAYPPTQIDTSAYDPHVFEFDLVELEVNETIKQILAKVEHLIPIANEEGDHSQASIETTSTETRGPPQACAGTEFEWQENQAKDMASIATLSATESLENSPEHDLASSKNIQADSYQHKPYDSSPDEATCDLVIDSSLPSNEPQDNQPETIESSMNDEPSSQTDSQFKESQSTIITTAQDETLTSDHNDVEMEEDQPLATQINVPISESLQSIDAKEERMPTTEEKGSHESVTTELDSTKDKSGSKSDPLHEPDEASKDNINEEVAKLCSAANVVTQIAASSVDEMRESPEEKIKEMAVLRNLEISPPPPPQEAKKEETLDVSTTSENSTTKRDNKRKRISKVESPSEPNESTETSGRGKRQRTQTKLFQIGTTSPNEDLNISVTSSCSSKKSNSKTSSRTRTKSTNSITSVSNLSAAQDKNQPDSVDQPDVIYDKNDYLAVRNEEDTFFLCQLTENVRVKRPYFKVKWLDTKDGGKTYFLTSQYDKVPQQSIIMPVLLDRVKSEKKGEQSFTISDQVKEMIMDRLKRSLIAQSGCNSSQEQSLSSQSTTQ